jgi:hypothetical protein
MTFALDELGALEKNLNKICFSLYSTQKTKEIVIG